MLQNWDNEKTEGMPNFENTAWEEGADEEDDGGEVGERRSGVPLAQRRGIGSYAAKLQVAEEQGLGTDPDQV